MKVKSVFFCSECGYESPKWMGKCPGCNLWNTLVEEKISPTSKKHSSTADSSVKHTPTLLKDVDTKSEERFLTGIGEFDRVLGGGIVKGSLNLIGGDPGIGKSTLLLQMCKSANVSDTILYASAEESQRQIKMRADRLGISNDNILLLAETNLNFISEAIEECKPSLVIIDSIQTVFCPEMTSAPGSVGQVREATMSLMRIAKEKNIAVFLVGHVTKDGGLAGPRVLEHMVDCVLYFEGERHRFHRILRGVKNRFGSTNEIGVFEMSDIGLKEVINPSAMLLSGRPKNVSGSCVVCSMEGTRPVLAEIQALATKTSYPVPKRMSDGFDLNRLSLLLAVIEKSTKISIGMSDVYINVTGGLKIDEPAADLGVVLSVISAVRSVVIPSDTAVMGEIGLTGEIRAVNNADKRIAEATRLGFETVILPKANKDNSLQTDKVKLIYVENLKELISVISQEDC